MKSDHVSGKSNQIPSTDEIMPDLFHSGIKKQKTCTVFLSSYIETRVKVWENEKCFFEFSQTFTRVSITR